MGKMFFVDLTRCTACRGCQVACKQWKNLPAEKTRNRGSHQNPPDLSGVTVRLVRFKETVDKDGRLSWNFFPEQCRHCLTPVCVDVADMALPGAMLHDEQSGAVLATETSARLSPEDVRAVSEACPYNIPRHDAASGRIVKCDMCIDRIREGLQPACVTSCPTGCMNFGEEDEIRQLAQKRLEEVQKDWPGACLGDTDLVRVIYLFKEVPEDYYEYAVADASRSMLARAGRARPAGRVSRRDLLHGVLRG